MVIMLLLTDSVYHTLPLQAFIPFIHECILGTKLHMKWLMTRMMILVMSTCMPL